MASSVKPFMAGIACAVGISALSFAQSEPDISPGINPEQTIEDARRYIEQNIDIQAIMDREIPEDFLETAHKAAEQASKVQAGAVMQAGIEQGVLPKSMQDGANANDEYADADGVAIFISYGMPEAELKSVVEAAAGRPRVTLVLRGLVPGTKNMGQTLQKLGELVKGMKSRPQILINPPPFKKYQVDVVPTMIKMGKKKGELAGRVEGNFNVDWFNEELDKREEGDSNLGRIGPVYEIAEEDLIDVMKRKAMAINWKEKQERAIAGFWKNQPDYMNLPVAREDRMRVIDPTVYVSQDVVAPNDKSIVIAKAGEKYNPLDKITFTRRVFVFNGSDPKQVKKVKEAAAIQAPGKVDVFITTEIDRQRGWEHHRELEDTFDAPIFMLQSDLANMFNLQRIPSVVTAKGKHLVINELKVPL